MSYATLVIGAKNQQYNVQHIGIDPPSTKARECLPYQVHLASVYAQPPESRQMQFSFGGGGGKKTKIFLILVRIFNNR